MLKVGILSTAKIAREHLIPAGLVAKGVCIQGIASRSLASAQTVAEHFQIPESYGSYDEMLASDSIQLVYIPLPTSQHIEWAIRAADAGKHVLVEKPLALHADDIQAVIDARERNGVIITEAFMVHYHPQWAYMREQIAAGRIGRLRHVQGAFSYYNRDPDNMRNQVGLGGGGLPDIGVYPTVTTRIATGQEPISVSAKVEFDTEFSTDIYANVHAEFEGFVVFPNPATGRVNISIGLIEASEIKIYNLMGALVHHSLANSKEVEIDVSTLKTGVYSVVVGTSDKYYSTRLVIE